LPTAKVTRQGKSLQLDYDLVDAGGRSYRNTTSYVVPGGRPAPRFVIYEGEREISSGTFRYG